MIKKKSPRHLVPKSVKDDKKTSLIRQRKLHLRKTLAFQNLTGTVKRHPDGFGFFIPEDPKYPADIYLSKRQMCGLMSNDKVKADIFSRLRGKSSGLKKTSSAPQDQKVLFSGKILQLVQRAQEFVIGQYLSLSDTTGIIRDNSFQWGEDLKIQIKKNQKIKAGEWVQAKITHWPENPKGLCGEVICSLGLFPEALEDNIRIVQRHNIPASFSSECLKEVNAIPESFSKDILDKRRDLKSLAFVTIDGKTAQDFDDAIYVSSHSRGWKLYVAIADVSHYVKKDSVMDKEARLRGNSSYFPGFTLPMLAEKLSNNLCSLKPHEDRLAFVAEIHFNTKGEKESGRFYSAVIQSQARLSYGSAQEIMEQAEDNDSDDRWPIEVKKNVLSAEKLARLLLEKRLEKHFINLEIPETEIYLNSLGEPMDIIQSRRLFSYQLIEELMLSANKAVAEYLQKNKIPSLYRVHDSPKPDSLKFLESFTRGLGTDLKLVEPDLQKKISFLIRKFADHHLSEVLQILILRSLSQAIYSAHNKKHFGLNALHYTHFTSPIRRYSDLVVHRILKSCLAKKALPYTTQELESIAEITSASEQRSVKAERQIKDIKKARFLKKRLGEEMEGIISSVTRFGIFIKLRLYDIEGLVHVKNLKGDWEFEESLLELKAKSSGFRFKMGDFVSIQVMSANIDTGQIDFKLMKHKGKESQLFETTRLSSGSQKQEKKGNSRRNKVRKKDKKRTKRTRKTRNRAKSGRTANINNHRKKRRKKRY